MGDVPPGPGQERHGQGWGVEEVGGLVWSKGRLMTAFQRARPAGVPADPGAGVQHGPPFGSPAANGAWLTDHVPPGYLSRWPG